MEAKIFCEEKSSGQTSTKLDAHPMHSGHVTRGVSSEVAVDAKPSGSTSGKNKPKGGSSDKRKSKVAKERLHHSLKRQIALNLRIDWIDLKPFWVKAVSPLHVYTGSASKTCSALKC